MFSCMVITPVVTGTSVVFAWNNVAKLDAILSVLKLLSSLHCAKWGLSNQRSRELNNFWCIFVVL
jgi:hypothetical protein